MKNRTYIRLIPGHHLAGCWLMDGRNATGGHSSLRLAIEYRLSCFWETITGKRERRRDE